MKLAALGICMHSGWGILVAVSGTSATAEIVERRHIVVVDEQMAGGKQPYHHAAEMGLPSAEKFLAEYNARCLRRMRETIAITIEELTSRGYSVSAAALLLAAGRVLPALPQILAAHPLIHTAEGELFRDAVRRACESLKIRVIGYRQRDLQAEATKTFGTRIEKITNTLFQAGRRLGPPWTADHKSAAMAAYLVLQKK